MSDIDVYDEAVAFFTANPELIAEAWCGPMADRPFVRYARALFGFLSEDRHDLSGCGCPTQVNSDSKRAGTEELTAAVRAIEGLPHNSAMLYLKDSVSALPEVVKALPLFAKAQRMADVALEREPL